MIVHVLMKPSLEGDLHARLQLADDVRLFGREVALDRIPRRGSIIGHNHERVVLEYLFHADSKRGDSLRDDPSVTLHSRLKNDAYDMHVASSIFRIGRDFVLARLIE